MKDSTTRFSNRVGDYVKFRPGYPEELFKYLTNLFPTKENLQVADIGAGTGISSKPFLISGNSVVAIEPNEPMREESIRQLNRYAGFCALDGTAENTKLPDNSVDLVFCAQAFHWFDPELAINEFNRILRKDGRVALVWNDRNTEDCEFSKEYEHFLESFALDYRQVNHKRFDRNYLESIIPFNLSEKIFQNEQLLDFEGLLGRVLSSSYMPARDHSKFEEMSEELKKLYHRHSFGDKVRMTYKTRLFHFTIDDQ